MHLYYYQNQKRKLPSLQKFSFYKLRKILIFRGAKVLCCDDFVNDSTFISQDELIEQSDIVIIGAPHESYNKIDFTHVKLINIWDLL